MYNLFHRPSARFHRDNGDYDVESERQKQVEEFYRMNHIHQSYDFVKKMREEYKKLDKLEMSIWECCELLNEVVDESDPDLDEPQIEHLPWKSSAPSKIWRASTVGCCSISRKTRILTILLIKLRMDYFGKDWSRECDELMGLDDYLVLVAKENGSTLPQAGLFIIRYHSFYLFPRKAKMVTFEQRLRRFNCPLKTLSWEAMSKLTALQSLNIENFPNILDISHEVVGNLISLKCLNLKNSGLSSRPNSLYQLQKLTKIILSSCTNLESIPNHPPNIKSLYAESCRNLVNLPSNISELQFLTDIIISDANFSEEIPHKRPKSNDETAHLRDNAHPKPNQVLQRTNTDSSHDRSAAACAA
ncbi:inositol oxygenase 4-like protein [Tanacetum coccineum]